MVNFASLNKECFSGTNVSFLLKESQLECHWKWQNRFNILAVKRSSFMSSEAQSQICQRGKVNKNSQHYNK